MRSILKDDYCDHDNGNNIKNSFINRALNFGSGLLSMGLVAGVHTMVGLYCRWNELFF